MKVSINWLNKFVDVADLDPNDIAEKLTMCGLEVDAVEELKALDNVVVAKVQECGKHPDADKLSLCQVFDGTETYQVVCGAPNVAAGQTVVFAKVGAVLPGDFKIKKAKIRGLESFGMICAEDEIGISEEHDGIMVLDDSLELGTPVSELFGWPDTVLEIGITPNRADCLSIIGYAREIAALYGRELKTEEFNINETDDEASNHAWIELVNKEFCPSYTGRVIKGVTIKPSPLWMQNRLRAVGVRPINNVVDITNYVLFEYGQPLHTFDLDEIEGNVTIKNADEGEKLMTLDEKERTFSSDMCLIKDEKKALSAAGVMGGEYSGITEKTKDVLLECAFFDAKLVRMAARRLGMQTDASYRYERGVDPVNTIKMIDYAAILIQELCGGDICKGILGEYNPPEPITFSVNADWINKYLGTDVSIEQMEQILTGLNLQPVIDGAEITVTAPPYRVDIKTRQDIAEEIARMYGYNNIPTTLPKIDADSMPMSPELETRKVLAQKLKTMGFNEAVNYSFMKDDFLKLFDDESKFVKLLNPISEDMNTMRTQVFPGLLATIKYNLNNGVKQCRFFEFASNFIKSDSDLPEQKLKLACAAAGDFWPMSWAAKGSAEPFFMLKGVLENLLSQYKISATFVKSDKEFLHPGKSADIIVNGVNIGFIGELHPSTAEDADIRERVTLFEIDMESFVANASFTYKFEAFSKFPSVYKDISVVVDNTTPNEKLIDCIKSTSKLAEDVFLFDIYSGKGIEEGQASRTFRVLFTAADRTLTDEETNEILQKMITNLTEKHNAQLR